MPVAVEVERSGARRPRQRCFAGQQHSDFRGGQRGFGDEDLHGPVRLVKNRFPVSGVFGLFLLGLATMWKRGLLGILKLLGGIMTA